MTIRLAILDDTQRVARSAAGWSAVEARCAVTIFDEPFDTEDEAASALEPFHILVPMRERTPFPASLIGRLPNLQFIALTGGRAPSLDLESCTRHGVVVSNTGGDAVGAATSELAFALIMACARHIPLADRTMRQGGWHSGIPMGGVLHGKRLGIAGLGRLGSRVAAYGRAFGMDVVAWSQNLTAAAAEEAGASLVSKHELFATSDAVSLHLVLSERTRGVVGADELETMKPGAILVNTSRGPLVDENALLRALEAGKIIAGLDVFDTEPLPANHPLRSLPNVVLSPHMGYSVEPVFHQFYSESVENALAYLDGNPIRVLNPDVLSRLKTA